MQVQPAERTEERARRRGVGDAAVGLGRILGGAAVPTGRGWVHGEGMRSSQVRVGTEWGRRLGVVWLSPRVGVVRLTVVAGNMVRVTPGAVTT